MSDTQNIGQEAWAALAGTWQSTQVGWNIISVPTILTSTDLSGFTLLIARLTETLRFTPVPDSARNRQARGDENDMHIAAMRYAQDIADETDTGIHAESGMWLLLNEDGDIARQGSVPHGNAFLALGRVTRKAGGPDIPDNTAVPDLTGTPDNLLGGITKQFGKRSDGGVVPDDLNIQNPNETLRELLGDRTITETITLQVDSSVDTAGILNIPFIVRNANTTQVSCTLWLMTVQEDDGTTSPLLAYSQQVDIRFKSRFDYSSQMMIWPHITFNVLTKQTA